MCRVCCNTAFFIIYLRSIPAAGIMRCWPFLSFLHNKRTNIFE
nr:MAG TPA: hypothetical protein [Caudoviricetes sp.]